MAAGRTKAFKKWFGDWELAAKLKAINDIIHTTIDRVITDKSEEKREYGNIGSATNKADGRDVQFFNTAFGKIYRNGGLFAQSIFGLKKCFENSICAYSEKDNKGGTKRSNGSIGLVDKIHDETRINIC